MQLSVREILRIAQQFIHIQYFASSSHAHVHNHHKETEASRVTEKLRSEVLFLYMDEIKDNLLIRDQHLLERALEDILEEPDGLMSAWIE